MKKCLFLLSFLCLTLTSSAQRYNWIKAYSSTGFSFSGNQRTESLGNNVFVGGDFTGSISFGSIVLTTPNPSDRDIFLAKYDTMGTIQWALQGVSGGTGSIFENFRSLAVDSAGNAYIAGIYSGTFTLGNLTISGHYNGTTSSREIFIAKISPNGTPLWIRGVYDINSTFISFNSAADMEIAAGKLLIVGETSGTIRALGTTLTAAPPFAQSNDHIWMGEYELNGTPINFSVPIYESNSSFNFLTYHGFEAKSPTDFVISGEFSGTYNFGTTQRTVSTSSLFFSKFNSSTNLDWVTISTQGNVSSGVIDIDLNDEVTFAGVFSGTLTIGGLTVTVPPNGSFSNWYVGKLNSNGSVRSLEAFDVNGSFSLNDIETNNKNESYIIGDFRDSLVINGVKRFSFGGSDLLIVKFDSVMNPIWFQTGGGGNQDEGNHMTTLPSGDVILVGYYRGLAQFGSLVLTGSPNFTPTGLIAKLSNCGEFEVPIQILGDTNLCQGEFVRLATTGDAGTTFQWYQNNFFLAGEVFRDYIATTTGAYSVVVNGSGCIDTSRAVQVNVGTPPTVTLNTIDTICQFDSAVVLTGGSPLGGVFSGLGVSNDSIFDPSITGIGNTSVTYTFSNGGCEDSASATIFVEPAPSLFFSPLGRRCINQGPLTLTNAFPLGGTFSGPGVTGNTFDPSVVGVGQYEITYSFTNANGCSNSTSQTITVDTIESARLPAPYEYCVNDLPDTLEGGLPVGGEYFGQGIANGIFDPSAVGVGTITIGYRILNDCGGDTTFTTIRVKPNPIISFSSIPELCIDDAPLSLNDASPAGGTYSGVGISNGLFEPDSSGVGTFTRFYAFTDTNGCSTIDSSSIIVHDLPVVTISADTSICDGESVDLVAGGGVSYLWSTGDNQASINVTPTASTEYSVLVTDANTCSNSDTVEVIVLANPIPSFTGTDTICFGDLASVTAAGGVSYLWAGGEQTASISAQAFSDTTFSVIVTGANGCTTEDSFSVKVNDLPVINFAGPADACFDALPITLNSGLPVGGNYSGIGVSGSSFNPPTPGTYEIVYDFIDQNGCFNADTAQVEINSLPIVSAGLDTSLCIGETIQLTASGGVTYLWDGGQNTSIISVNPMSDTDYSVIATDSNGCQGFDTVSVVVNALPVIGITGDTAICSMDSAFITASGAISYLWNTGANSSQIAVSPSVATIYSVAGTDLNGCQDSAQVSLQVNALPIVTMSSLSGVCVDSDTFSLTVGAPIGGLYSGAGVIGNSFDPVSAGVGNFQIGYSFTDGNGCTDSASTSIEVYALPIATISPDTSICDGESIEIFAGGGSGYLWNTGDTTSSILVSPLATSSYTVSVSDQNGCSDSDSMMVTVLNQPTISVSSADTTVCANEPVMLTAISSNGSYLWSTGDTTATIIVTPSISQTYNVETGTFGRCIVFDSVNVNVDALPQVSLSNDTSICEGESLTLAVSGGTPILWNTGDTVASIFVTPLSTQTYSVTIGSSIGCSNSDSVQITVFEQASISISSFDTTVCATSSVILAAISSNGSYLWNTGDTTASILINPTSSQTYVVETGTLGNCLVFDSVRVDVNALPSVSLGIDSITLNNCLDTTFQFNAGSGFASYLWQDGSGDSTLTIDFDPTKVGTSDLITVLVSDINGCSNSDTAFVSYEVCTGFDGGTISLVEFKVYPNPARDILRLESNIAIGNEAEIVFRDVNGVRVKPSTSWELESDLKRSLNLEGISPGTYFLEIRSEDFSKVVPVVIIK